MSKSAMIRARVEPELKAEVEEIFQELGLTTTEAITLFYHQVRTRKGIPFEIIIPNKTTVETNFTLMTSGDQLVTGDYDWDPANKEMTFTPEYSLQEDTDYSINLTTQVTDLYDIAMEEAERFS